MKRLSLLLVALSLAITGLVAPVVAAADTQAFTIESFTADYYLSKDEEGRSRMKVREVIVAEFPAFDQNHGIERAIPDNYDGHSVALSIESVKKGDATHWNYSTYGSNGHLVLRIGDADRFVHGKQTYVIEYQLRDVTKGFTEGDELFWDVNGTGWQQPFGVVTARVHVPAALTPQLSDQTKCFVGISGSTDERCSKQAVEESGQTTYTFSAAQLSVGENLSFVVGFKPNSFESYKESPLMIMAIIAAILLGLVWYVVVPTIVLVRSILYWRRHGRDPRGRGTIIPEYVPPRDVSVIDSSVILEDRVPTSAISATIIDLAVRHYIKLYEIDDKKLFKTKEYEAELLKSSDDLRPEEQAVLRLFFGAKAPIGSRLKISGLSDPLYLKVADIGKTAEQRTIKNGYMIDSKAHQKKMTIWGVVMLVAAIFTANLPLVVAAVVMLALGYHMPARTDKGVVQRDYLLGLKHYMQLAEADRLKALQSPTGAVTGNVSTGDNAQLVRLYEKILPYAILFGIEKEWIKQFAKLYAQPPDWYSGNWSTFNAATFASSLGNLGAATASSFAPPSSSSSSGFSGGGSSGGGGGGGGGGGW